MAPMSTCALDMELVVPEGNFQRAAAGWNAPSKPLGGGMRLLRGIVHGVNSNTTYVSI
jgi:hypothetical protein